MADNDAGPRGTCIDYWKMNVPQLHDANTARGIPTTGDNGTALRKNDLIAYLAAYDCNVPAELTKDVAGAIQPAVGLAKESMEAWAATTFPELKLSGTKANYLYLLTQAALKDTQGRKSNTSAIEAERVTAPAAESATNEQQQHAAPAADDGDDHMQGNTPPRDPSTWNAPTPDGTLTDAPASSVAQVPAPVNTTTVNPVQAHNPFSITNNQSARGPPALRASDLNNFTPTPNAFTAQRGSTSYGGDLSVFTARTSQGGPNIFSARPALTPTGTAAGLNNSATRLGLFDTLGSPVSTPTSNMFSNEHDTTATPATAATPTRPRRVGATDHYQSWARESIMNLLQQAVINDPDFGNTVYEGSQSHQDTADAVRQVVTSMAEFERHKSAAEQAYRRVTESVAVLTRKYQPQGQ